LALTYVNQVGAVEGINQAAPGAFIPDTSVRWAQDVLFDQVGYLRRRPPFNFFELFNSTPPIVVTQPSVANERIITVVSTLDPNGKRIMGLVVATNNSSRIIFYDEKFQIANTASLGAVLPSNVIYDCKQASTGGMWLSFLESYAAGVQGNDYYQYYWYGGHGVEHSVQNTTFNTIDTASYETYTDTINGSFNETNITPGMFVFVEYNNSNLYYIGTVNTATSGTVTLQKDIIRFRPTNTVPKTGLTIHFKNVRPFIKAHGRGLITRANTNTQSITSGSIGTEGEGHFAAAQLGATNSVANYALYRASDGEWIGDIDTVNNNAALTLDSQYHSHQTNTIMTADEYIIWPYNFSLRDNNPQVTNSSFNAFGGVFTTTYAGLQWYANGANYNTTNRLIFSADHSAEATDLSIDSADSINIPTDEELRGIATSTSGLLIFTADKTYILRGNYRSNFALEELYPEGCLSTMSIVEYGGGVFWTSRAGILFYDGATVINLIEKNLGSYYTDSIKTYNVNDDRIYSFLHKDYLFIYFSAFDSAFKPTRYEPIYAEGIVTTPATQAFSYTDINTINEVSNKQLNNGIVTLTSNNHSFLQGQTIRVSISDARFDGTFLIDSVTQNTLQYTNVGNNVISSVATGTIELLFDDTPVWDEDFTVNDFTVESNTPLYWESIELYDSIGTNSLRTVPIWQTSNAAPYTYFWGNENTQNVWGPARVSDGICFAIYLPTNAITTLSNFDFFGSTTIDNIYGIKTVAAVNAVIGTNDVRARLIDVDSILTINEMHDASEDEALIENLGKSAETYIKGPDFYIQTKQYTVGDPVLRKWFRNIMLNMSLLDGGIRMDVVDMEDKDYIDISKKRHKNWEIFEANNYNWIDWTNIISPKLSSPYQNSWQNIQALNKSWYDFVNFDFNRYVKKISWRYPSIGFRLYQMNNYRPGNYQTSQRPYSVLLDSWNIGFKPLRNSRM